MRELREWLRHPPLAVAGMLLLGALMTLIVAIAAAGTGQGTLALRVLAVTAVLLAAGFVVVRRR